MKIKGPPKAKPAKPVEPPEHPDDKAIREEGEAKAKALAHLFAAECERLRLALLEIATDCDEVSRTPIVASDCGESRAWKAMAAKARAAARVRSKP